MACLAEWIALVPIVPSCGPETSGARTSLTSTEKSHQNSTIILYPKYWHCKVNLIVVLFDGLFGCMDCIGDHGAILKDQVEWYQNYSDKY